VLSGNWTPVWPPGFLFFHVERAPFAAVHESGIGTERTLTWRKRSSAEQAPSEGAQDLKVKTGKSYDVMSGAGAGRAKNGKPAFVPRQRQYRSTRPLTRDQNGHAGFLIHTAYGRRRPGRYHTILSR